MLRNNVSGQRLATHKGGQGCPAGLSCFVPSFQSKALMTTSSLSLFAMALSVALNLVALYFFLKVRRSRPQSSSAPGKPGWSPADVPDAVWHTEAATGDFTPTANPVVEAEVFLAYGRHEDAAQVLQAALRDGRIGADELEGFWARHGDCSIAPTLVL